MLTKVVLFVGVDGGLPQLRSTRPRTSVAQHCAFPVVPEQTVAWRSTRLSSAGMAMANGRIVAAMMENLIIAIDGRYAKIVEEIGLYKNES